MIDDKTLEVVNAVLKEMSEKKKERYKEMRILYGQLVNYLIYYGPETDEYKQIMDDEATKQFIAEYNRMEMEEYINKFNLATMSSDEVENFSRTVPFAPYIPMVTVRNDIKPIKMEFIWL